MAVKIYDSIHTHSIRYEESIFRKDYFMNYLRILLMTNNYVDCIKILSQEIDFLLDNQSSIFESISVYILDLMLVYMVTHNAKEIEEAFEILE